MGERKGTKGLELWCRRMTEGYPGVNVVNMTTSWRDGLAFCAIIHHFRPDLIEFSKLNKDDIYYNNELAFRTAERHLGIPALLEPEDMVEFPVPDRLSILTYLSQFYQTFVVAQGKSTARIAAKRTATSPEHSLVSPASSSPPTKVAFPSAGKVRREPCAKCGLPVFIAERLNVGKLLYHRTCFRCARCDSQLTLANYYETENNEFCCETCPDEEKSPFGQPDPSVLTRSLSDEEKSASLKKQEETDDYSAEFETALEYPEDDSLKRSSTLTQSAKARSFFISSQVEANSDSGNEDEPPPDLPKTKPPARENVTFESFSDSGFPKDKLKTHVNTQSSVSLSNTSSKLEKSHDIVTKDTISAEGKTNSLVKARMRLFETKSDAPNETNSVNNTVPLRNSTSANIEVGKNKKEDSRLHSFKDDTLDKNTSKRGQNSVTNILHEKKIEAVKKSGNEETSMEINVPHKADDSIITISDDTEKSVITITDSTEDSFAEANSKVIEDPSAVSFFEASSKAVEDTSSFVTSDVSSPEEKNEEDEKIKSDELEETPYVTTILPSKHEESTESINATGENNAKLEGSLENLQVPGEKELEVEDRSTLETEKVVERKLEVGDTLESIEITGERKLEVEDPNIKDIKVSDEEKSGVEDGGTLEILKVPSRKKPEVEDESPSKTVNVPSKRRLVEEHRVLEEKPVEPAVVPPPRIEISPQPKDEYPDDLNPFGDDDEPEPEEAKKPDTSTISLNPFEDEEDDSSIQRSPKPAARRKIKPSAECKQLPPMGTNPFEEDEEEEVPQPVRRKVIAAPKISLNPFWSDDEENQDGKPVPKPRLSKSTVGAPEPKPRESGLSLTSSTFGSSSSVTSSQSGHTKKKKPAPRPPMLSGTESGPSSLTSSPSHSVTHSPRSTPKVRKAKKAPLPPTSTPIEGTVLPLDLDDFEREKFAKDEQNRNRQSQNLSLQSPSSSENSSSLSAPNKSTYGKWKRRKGQAPSRPIPQRRAIKSLPMAEVRRELELIEIQQQGLEKQGVRLEQIIRERCEGPDVSPDDSLSPEIEDMVLQLFELVNEKNELFRKQAELMYLRRQQKLEEEHADIEYQIRCLMLQPEANKTDSDKAREEELINRLVEIVERRNEIIECLEMDRVREAEEDDSINNQLNLYTQKKEEDKSSENKQAKKEKKKHKKEKKFKLKGHKVDADKDIDESESSASSTKEKKKKKFNIF